MCRMAATAPLTPTSTPTPTSNETKLPSFLDLLTAFNDLQGQREAAIAACFDALDDKKQCEELSSCVWDNRCITNPRLDVALQVLATAALEQNLKEAEQALQFHKRYQRLKELSRMEMEPCLRARQKEECEAQAQCQWVANRLCRIKPEARNKDVVAAIEGLQPLIRKMPPTLFDLIVP